MDEEEPVQRAPSPDVTGKQAATVPDIDPVAEKKLVRKLDLHIIPFVMLLYLFSFLDRVNIGNARLYGLEEDLGLTGNQYQTAVSILFVTYLLAEVPSNLVLKKFTPSRWISFITTAWGIIATLTGVTQSYAGLIVCRLLLGLVEGGLFPGAAVYLTLFYTKRELALRVGYLFISAAIAGAVGGLLAYGIGSMDGVAGQRGWRWILILEGLPSFVLGIATWFLLADDPETAFYLSSEEKHLIKVRRDRQLGQTSSAQRFHKADVYAALKDWKVYAFCAGQFGTDTMLYGYSTFLPTIIKGLGTWSTAQTQALTIPCYCLGALSYVVAARISDSQQRRGLYTVLFGGISVIGYGILISDSSTGVHYLGCFLVAMGLYVTCGVRNLLRCLSFLRSSTIHERGKSNKFSSRSIALVCQDVFTLTLGSLQLPLAWLPNNSPRYGKRTTATGLQLTIGNSSGIMAPFVRPLFNSLVLHTPNKYS
ncbi:MAG: hypothetical protein L6R36_000591 [Xanthoria steineri]|nr:MAG: hypothetical protein L6R36_000591 [Xanthoria steineri]